MEVSNLGQGIFTQGLEKGLAQGRIEGLVQGRTEERLEMLDKVMKKLNFNIEQALQFVEIPQDQQEMYRELLRKNNT